MPTLLFDAFSHHVHTRSSEIAIVALDDCGRGAVCELTWPQLSERVAAIAYSIERKFVGEEPHQRCVLYRHSNRLSDICLSLACMAVGVIEVPIDDRRESSHIDFVRAVIEGIWVDDEFVNKALRDEMRPRDAIGYLSSLDQATDPDDPALILWTTGTLAQPKGVVLSHRNLHGNAQAKLKAVPQSVDDVRLTTLPISHAYARTCDFGTWLLSGCTLVLSLGYRGWETIANEYPPTLANVVPTLAYRLLESRDSLAQSRLRLLGVGGAPLSHGAFERFRESGVTVIQGYGLTETSPVVCSATPTNATAGLVGHPVTDCEVELRDQRLFVRGPHVMLGYWQDEVATRVKIDDDGWLDTGDFAEIDEGTSQYRIIGRADDLVVLPNGNKLHPRDIEAPIEELLEVAHALVVLNDGKLNLWFDSVSTVEESEIAARINQTLQSIPAWMRPTSISRFVPRLSISRGELTFKGGIRRREILSARFGSTRVG